MEIAWLLLCALINASEAEVVAKQGLVCVKRKYNKKMRCASMLVFDLSSKLDFKKRG